MGNHVTDEERLERIKRVLTLVGSGMSLRQCANYLSENEFEISYVTVRDYVNRAKLLNYDYKLASENLEKNKPKTIEDEKVKQRIKKVCDLKLKGLYVEEIAKILGLTPMIIYRDLNTRLYALTNEDLKELEITKEQIKEIENGMTINSLNNLKNR